MLEKDPFAGQDSGEESKRTRTETAMTASPLEFDRRVLEAVSEDYQSFESVVSKLCDTNHPHSAIMEVERVLLSSIAQKLVAAYLLHADPPSATEVGPASGDIRR